jgi:two-component system, OmpR family, response regulator
MWGGWEVILAASGSEALSLAATHQPDLILLDVMMPGMDGLTTFTNLRQSDVTRGIPVVFVTAKALRREHEQYLNLGVEGVIVKPFDPMTLPDTIRGIVQSL